MSDASNKQADEFTAAAEKRRSGLLGEIWAFLRVRKKWWLAPIIVLLLLIAAILVVGAASPWIYTLF